MTKAESITLDAQLYRRDGYVITGHALPPALTIGEIAKRFEITEAEVKVRVMQLFPETRDA